MKLCYVCDKEAEEVRRGIFFCRLHAPETPADYIRYERKPIPLGPPDSAARPPVTVPERQCPYGSRCDCEQHQRTKLNAKLGEVINEAEDQLRAAQFVAYDIANLDAAYNIVDNTIAELRAQERRDAEERWAIWHDLHGSLYNSGCFHGPDCNCLA